MSSLLRMCMLITASACAYRGIWLRSLALVTKDTLRRRVLHTTLHLGSVSLSSEANPALVLPPIIITVHLSGACFGIDCKSSI